MNRRAFITLLSFAAFGASAGIGHAASVADGIIAQLAKQGFTDISSETTWLGRLRILAHRKDGSREIVINPRTGEILRDQFTALNGGSVGEPILDDVDGGDSHGSDDGGSDNSGSGGSGSDDNGSGDGGSDSSGSDDGGSDNSGSGSSGSGSSGSGSGSHGGGSGHDDGGKDSGDDDKGDDN